MRTLFAVLLASILLPYPAQAQPAAGAVIDARPGWFLSAPGWWLLDTTITDPGGSGTVRLFIDARQQRAGYSTSNQDIAIDVWKDGPSGTARTPGIAVNHTGLGSGDNFYSQVPSSAVEFTDALYCGDLDAPRAQGVFGAWLFSGAGAPGVIVHDLRPQGGPSLLVRDGTADAWSVDRWGTMRVRGQAGITGWITPGCPMRIEGGLVVEAGC